MLDGLLDGLLEELATTLRRGVEEQRGAPVQRMTAALTMDADHRLTGLSGNADGQAPVPSPETFDRIADVLARLVAVEGGDCVTAVTVRVDGDSVTHDARPRSVAGDLAVAAHECRIGEAADADLPHAAVEALVDEHGIG